MGKGKNGVESSALNSTVNSVDGLIQELASELSTLKAMIEELNAQYWYGGERAGKWYTNMSNTMTSLTKFYNQCVTLNQGVNDIYKSGRGVAYN